MKRHIESVLIWSGSAVLTVILWVTISLLSGILYPFDRQRRVAHAQCFWWAKGIMLLNPCWNVSVSGLEHIDRRRTYVVVANHQSLADVVVLYRTKMQFKWVAKESLFKVPVVGWSMRLCKHIRLARGEFSSIKRVYREAAEWLRQDMSVLFFPEGTRSMNGEMNDFQNGAFKLAIRERVPILPIAIRGTGSMIPKGSWLLKTEVPGSVTVLPAIETDRFTAAGFAALRDEARAAIMQVP